MLERENYNHEGERVSGVDWHKFLATPPPRKEIDPKGNLSVDELKTRVDEYFKSKNIDAQSMGSFEVSEYPEFIDQEIRDLCLQINKSDFAKTAACCAGHEPEVDWTQPNYPSNVGRVESNLDYIGGDLTLLIDHQSEKGRKLMEELQQLATGLSEKHQGFSIEIGHENLGEITRVSSNLSEQVPDQRIEKQGRRPAAELDKIIADKKREMKVVDPPHRKGFSRRRDYQKALDNWWQTEKANYDDWTQNYQFGLYWEEYGDYFKTPESRQPIREFFDGVEKIFKKLTPELEA